MVLEERVIATFAQYVLSPPARFVQTSLAVAAAAVVIQLQASFYQYLGARHVSVWIMTFQLISVAFSQKSHVRQSDAQVYS